MPDLLIRVLGDPILRVQAKEVDSFDENLENTLAEMLSLMVGAEGMGLAAPQVGIPRRFFVARYGDNDYRIINPRITAQEGQVVDEEGCLSIPNQYGPVERWEWIRLAAQNVDGEKIEMEAEGLLARVFQHEIDHLDGCLFIDRMKREVGDDS